MQSNEAAGGPVFVAVKQAHCTAHLYHVPLDVEEVMARGWREVHPTFKLVAEGSTQEGMQ